MVASLVGPFTAYAFFCGYVGIVYGLTPRETLMAPLQLGIPYGPLFISVWLCGPLPLYLWVPKDSVLWRWPLCTVCGALAGAIILVARDVIFHLENGRAALGQMGACIGGVNALVSSLTRRWFR